MRDLALVQTGLPLLMIGWLLFGRAPTSIDLALRLGAAWALLLSVWLVGLWLAMPIATLAILAALLVIASLVASRRTGRTRERKLLSSPASPAAYLTYGAPVYSLCKGNVEDVEQGRPDLPVPLHDREHLEGNFVRLRCGPTVVLLAHFARRGVRVARGQKVSRETLLGYVGNSGNTDEPHLHIHAQRPGSDSAPLSGGPLFVTFEGRFLARNMVVDAAR